MDMSIRVVSRRLVKASDASIKPQVLYLSNLDLYACDTQFCTLYVYPNSGDGGFSARIPSLFEAVLPSLLNHLFPFAGRVVTNPSSGLPELHCHNQGAELVVGEAVGVALRDLDYGCGTAKDSVKKIKLPFPKDVILSVQLLSFSCGGFSVMWGMNHLVGDGYIAAMLVTTFSELARTGAPLNLKLNHDRSVFRPRRPPSYSDSVAAMFTAYDVDRLPNALTADASFVDRLYYVEAGDIAALRDEASTAARRSTRVQALSAYVWKALAAVVAACPRASETERCRMGWWVTARQRLSAPELAAAMRGYVGNATAYTLGDAPVEELVRKPLAEVADMVRGAIDAPGDYDEYMQEMVDFMEVHKAEGMLETAIAGVGAPTLSQSVLTTFPVDTDFGLGHATLAMPVLADAFRLCSSFLSIVTRPGGDGSWLFSAYIWPQLAAALESDGIFKPLTAEYLGLTQAPERGHEQGQEKDPTPCLGL